MMRVVEYFIDGQEAFGGVKSWFIVLCGVLGSRTGAGDCYTVRHDAEVFIQPHQRHQNDIVRQRPVETRVYRGGGACRRPFGQ